MTSPAADGAALVTLTGVSHRYGPPGHPLSLNHVDLEVAPGTFAGVVGPSGSGKTSLLRVLTGALRPTEGQATRRPDLRVGYVPQAELIDWSFPVSVSDVVLMGCPPTHRWPWAHATERRRADEALDQLGLTGLGRRHIRDLSGGQQQRVFLARALLQEAELLVLDEPTAGIDVASRHDLLHRLIDLHRATGVSVVLSTHDLNGIAAHLPHLVCLNRGVVACGPPATVLVPEVLERTFGAPMEVLVHGGMTVVVDRPALRHAHPGHSHHSAGDSHGDQGAPARRDTRTGSAP